VATRSAAIERLPMERVNALQVQWRGFNRAICEVGD
jgi:hypothetical protein